MTDSSVFSCLPVAVRDRILQQAFQQLDQRHLFGVAPRVCRFWHQLSLSIITSLDIRIRTGEAAEQLSLWMTNHGTSLQHLNLILPEPMGERTDELQPLLQSVGAADQLRSLNISTPFMYEPPLDLSLTSLTKLTSLRIKGCAFSGGTLYESIPHATTLRSLSLETVYNRRSEWGTFMQQVSANLVQLTRLDLNGILGGILTTDIALLRALPQLQQLQLNCDLLATHLSNLRSMPVTVARIFLDEETVEADLCSWLLQSAANLRELSFVRNRLSTIAPVPPLVPLQQASQLRNLFIDGLQPNMTEVAALTQLTRLALEECGLDDTAVCKLSTLSELRVLSLRQNAGISGAQGSMEVLADSMPHLTGIKLGYTNAWEPAKHAFVSRKVALQHS